MVKLRRISKLECLSGGENYIDVSRPNIFGNPYTHIKNKKTTALIAVANKDEAIRLYSKYFDAMLAGSTSDSKLFRGEWERIIGLCDKYDYLYFMCYCKPEEPCHADVIIEKLRRHITRKKIKEVYDRRKKQVNSHQP